MQTRVSTDPDDIEHILEIVRSFGASPEALIGIRKHVAAELAHLGEERFLYLLTDGEAVVAAVQLVLRGIDDDLQLADGRTTAHIHALQVKKTSQRQGFGERLMLALEEHAKSLGLTKLTLAVDSDNFRAIRLYEKLAYTFIKEKVRPDAAVPVRYLEKSL